MKVQDAKRQQQDRELQTQQEEEERLLRKKVGVRRLTRAMGVRKAGLLIRINTFPQRIEEIMKRTRKGEADLKVL